MNRASLFQGLAALAVGAVLGSIYSKRSSPDDIIFKPVTRASVAVPIKPESAAVEVLRMSGADQVVAALIKMPLEHQMEAWDSACKTLLEAGRWQEAISLALLAPHIRIDEKSVFPLGWVMEAVAKERASEAFAWLQEGVLSGNKGAGGGLSALLDAWQGSDRPMCLQALREMTADNALLRYTRKNIILDTLRSEPSLVSDADLQQVFPESADPSTVIRELGQAMGAKDPARAIEWARTLTSAAQRSYAVHSAATGAATSDHPAMWQILENVKDRRSREDIAGVWTTTQFQQKGLAAEGELARIPDASLRAAAANSLVKTATKANLAEAAGLAARLASSGVSGDLWTGMITSSGIEPGAWKSGSQEPKLSFLAQMPPETRAHIFQAAAVLAKPKVIQNNPGNIPPRK